MYKKSWLGNSDGVKILDGPFLQLNHLENDSESTKYDFILNL